MRDAASFLRDRKQQLAAALGEVERQAAGDQLPDAGIRNGRLAMAPLPDPILAHVWPLAWDHINLTGDYTWSGDAPRDPDRLRDLRLDQLTPPLPLQQAA